MSNTVKQKQKRTIIISCVLAVLLLAGSLFVAIDGIIHMNDPYKDFADQGFAAAIAQALGKESVRDLTQADLDGIESLVYYFDIGLDANNNYSTKFAPIVLLGNAQYTDAVVNNESPVEGTYTAVYYPVLESADLTMFKNLRVLRAFDVVEVSRMQQGCMETQYAAMYGGDAQTVDFASFIEAYRLKDLKNLSQISCLTKLEQLSIEYTGITSLNGIEYFQNLKKLDIGNTVVTDLGKLSEVKSLEVLTAVAMGERVKDSKDDHTHEGLTDLTPVKDLENLKQLEISYNAVSDLSPLSGLKNLTMLGLDENCVENFDALESITTLEGISANNNHLKNVDGIKNNKELTLFAVNGNKEITDISAIENCVKLETVIVNDNKIENIGDLSKLDKLEEFTANNNKIKDISSLHGCTSLGSLTVNDNQIEVLSKDGKTFSGLDALVSVSLQNNKIKDLNAFNGCEKLENLSAYNNTLEGELNLTECPALKTVDVHVEAKKEETKDETKDESKDESKEETKEDTTEKTEDEEKVEEPKTGLSSIVVKGLKKLETLNVSGNILTAIPDITDCEALVTLNVNDNLIEKLDNIENAKVLTTLFANNNKISDVSKLEAIKTLKTLELTGNALADIKAFEKLTALVTLKLDDNKELEDISVFESFPTTSALELTIVGTKAAENIDKVKQLQASHSSMKITYVQATKK